MHAPTPSVAPARGARSGGRIGDSVVMPFDAKPEWPVAMSSLDRELQERWEK